MIDPARLSFDTVIVGGGVIGLTIGLELRRRSPSAKIAVLEAENTIAAHASGRNSGVLHSGVYYPPGSLKARMSAAGSAAMREYCTSRNLPLLRIGKILLPTRPQDDPQLDLLASRAVSNGVEAHLVDAKALQRMEPECRSASGRALFVPATAVCSPKEVMASLVADCAASNIDLRMGWRAKNFDVRRRLAWNDRGERVSYRFLINAAGLHADSISHEFGVARHLRILPFKGLYWQLDPRSGIRLNHLVYPVPDLRVPFLGVHTTLSTDGDTYLGPTAIPALGRENYRGLEGVRIADAASILAACTVQFSRNTDGFRRLAIMEGGRLFRRRFADAARRLLPRLENRHLMPCGKVGMRAQLYDSRAGRMVTDFLVERGPWSIHVLNAISPAWTCSIPFASYICDRLAEGPHD